MGTEVADKQAGLKAALRLLLPQVNSKGKMKMSSIGKCKKTKPNQKQNKRPQAENKPCGRWTQQEQCDGEKRESLAFW